MAKGGVGAGYAFAKNKAEAPSAEVEEIEEVSRERRNSPRVHTGGPLDSLLQRRARGPEVPENFELAHLRLRGEQLYSFRELRRM